MHASAFVGCRFLFIGSLVLDLLDMRSGGTVVLDTAAVASGGKAPTGAVASAV